MEIDNVTWWITCNYRIQSSTKLIIGSRSYRALNKQVTIYLAMNGYEAVLFAITGSDSHHTIL